MRALIKYREWRPDYLSAVMEEDEALLSEKVARAESAILRRKLLLASGDGSDSANELKALESALKGLRMLKTMKLNQTDGE